MMMVLPVFIGVPYKVTAFVTAMAMLFMFINTKDMIALVAMTMLIVITGKYEFTFITVTMMITLTSESISTDITSGLTLIIALVGGSGYKFCFINYAIFSGIIIKTSIESWIIVAFFILAKKCARFFPVNSTITIGINIAKSWWPLSVATWFTDVIGAIAITVVIVCTTTLRAGIGF